jgi:hypothetical protein
MHINALILARHCCLYIGLLLPFAKLWGQTDSGFSDSATFTLYVNQEKVGTNQVVLSPSGSYFRDFTLNMAGQTINFTMVSESANRNPAEFEAVNPTYGKINIRLEDGKAEYNFQTQVVSEVLPSSYILYDDYGSLFESLMFLQYDRASGGKQSFRRYRFSENPELQNTHIEVSIEYLEDEELRAKGLSYVLHKYDWEVFGIHATYWIDNDGRIYKTESSYDNSVGIRAGFEEFLDFVPE